LLWKSDKTDNLFGMSASTSDFGSITRPWPHSKKCELGKSTTEIIIM
jgi:hypothetical protein